MDLDPKHINPMKKLMNDKVEITINVVSVFMSFVAIINNSGKAHAAYAII